MKNLTTLIISFFLFTNLLSSQTISVDPDSLYQYLLPGESATQTLTISNSGIDDHTFYFDTTLANPLPVVPQSADYHTGTTDGSSLTETSLIKAHGGPADSKEAGWAIFNIPAICPYIPL